MQLVTVHPAFEQQLGRSLQRTEAGSFLDLDPDLGMRFLESLSQTLGVFRSQPFPVVVLTSTPCRLALRTLTQRSFPCLTVLSQQWQALR